MRQGFPEKKIKEFWEERAQEGRGENEITHRDIWQRWLEIEYIKAFLDREARVIDIGCGNGHTTGLIAPLVKEVTGIDYSKAMIERARAASPRIAFGVCDVMDLGPSGYGTFDVAISERCLINLTSWKDQKKAIGNIASVIKKGGLFLFIEGSQDGRRRLNEARVSIGLDAMPPVWHNLDFDEKKLTAYLKKFFTIEKRLHFGIYDLIARVVHPLLVAPEEPKYEARINEIAAQMALKRQDCRDISRTIFLALRKK